MRCELENYSDISLKNSQLTVTSNYVREVFKGLEHGDGTDFFAHDDVDWTVMGTHPLSGHYHSNADFIAGTFAKLDQVLPQGAELHLEHLIVEDNQGVVELRSAALAKNGMRFNNCYCWIVLFENEAIVRVRTSLDSAMVANLFKENPITLVPSEGQTAAATVNLRKNSLISMARR
jgi:ketosteroid isomerase-like protein